MGTLISTLLILLWGLHLFYSLHFVKVDLAHPSFLIHTLIQGYLYTGLFITGHDAIHGNIHKSKLINKIFGYISAFLFAGLSYKKLAKNHFAHHKSPGEIDDPDYYIKSQNFFIWWSAFLFRYVTFFQLVIMAILFNVLKIWFEEISIFVFWVIPAFIGTFQLFYFGTYQPHKLPHTNEMIPHNARTQKGNHLWAMLSCYFFGYHWEHHEYPKTPWWQLYKIKKSRYTAP